MGKKQAVLVITRKSVKFYRSIVEASKALGIDQSRVKKALYSDDGYIRNTFPPICVDYAPDFMAEESREI